MYVNNGTSTIRRVWFKDGRTTDNSAAINKEGGTLTLESCIFSGNYADTNRSYTGGAIRNYGGNLDVKGCTFYNNSGGTGVIARYSGTLTITGNLFYGNTAPSRVINGTATSRGYNAVDDVATPGYTAVTGDKTISAGVLPVSPASFRPLPGSGASNSIATLPADYPAKDFYGNAITAGAAIGAVQGTTASGYSLVLSVNSSSRGTVSASPSPDVDGIVSSTSITATPKGDWKFAYWLVDGNNVGYTNPLSLTLTDHTVVQAVFGVFVTDYSDDNDSANRPGTLRHALADPAVDVIRIGTPGQTIELTERLPTISKNVTIDGNSGTITRHESWTTSSDSSQLMFISSGTVTISRVWFKDSRANWYGGAIRAPAGILTLESCIFSGNHANPYGGAIYSVGPMTLNVRGCTFYNNSAGQGGAIYLAENDAVALTLAGNLFYGNTATENSVIRSSHFRAKQSSGYNVVDVALGTSNNQSGFVATTGDATIATILGSNETSPFVDITDPDNLNLAPVSELQSLIPTATWTVGTNTVTMPALDFYGELREWPGATGAVK
jgi:predicted outer membrane repeat protein